MEITKNKEKKNLGDAALTEEGLYCLRTRGFAWRLCPQWSLYTYGERLSIRFPKWGDFTPAGGVLGVRGGKETAPVPHGRRVTAPGLTFGVWDGEFCRTEPQSPPAQPRSPHQGGGPVSPPPTSSWFWGRNSVFCRTYIYPTLKNSSVRPALSLPAPSPKPRRTLIRPARCCFFPLHWLI